MITKELLKRALDTATDNCTGETNGCVHGPAVDQLRKELEREMGIVVAQCLIVGASPTWGLFDMGMHVGYRLHQLETDPTPTPNEKVN